MPFSCAPPPLVGIVLFVWMLASVMSAVNGLNRKVDNLRKEACDRALAREVELNKITDRMEERRRAQEVAAEAMSGGEQQAGAGGKTGGEKAGRGSLVSGRV